MKLIHTSDWHLGRLFYGVHLTEDQAHVLDQLITVIRETKADVLLVSGDIYDRAVPPPEAVKLLDEVLSRIVLGLRVPVILITGNHDSPDRLGFGWQLLAQQGLHIRGSVSASIDPVIVSDAAGPVYIYPIPYAEPAIVRQQLGRDTIHDHEAAMQSLIEGVWSQHPPGARSVLIAHAFVAGGEASESERPLSIGGSGLVPAACFEGFHYVALGHLHRPQLVGCASVNYAGSLLKYSFAEANQTKSVSLVQLDAQGHCQVERIPLTPRRDVRRLEGSLADILKGPRAGENPEDYIMVTLLDKGAILDAMGQIRKVYPNALHLERPVLDGGGQRPASRVDHRVMDEVELFSQFFAQVTDDELTEEQKSAYVDLVRELRQHQREVRI